MRGRGLREKIRLLTVAGAAVIVGCCGNASADTLEWALVQAYQNNPSLNAQRAALRAVDESVPQALSGYRPKLSVTAAAGYNYFSEVNKAVNQQVFPNSVNYTSIGESLPTRQFGATATQTLFNGFQTANRTRQAESQVAGARETLRVTEQQVLLDAATSYMNLLRDQAILDLNRRNVEVLTEQLKQTRDRFNVGEVTRTDVAQAESRLAAGRSSLLGAQSNYVTSQANYRRVIGVDPGRLDPGTPVDRLSPATLARAIVEGQTPEPIGAGGDVRRRRRRARGESQRRRALSQCRAHGDLHAEL
jgi:outer membrane protein